MLWLLWLPLSLIYTALSMFTVQVFNTLSEEGLCLLSPSRYETVNENPDAILLRSHSLHDMQVGSRLKAIARAGAGTNNIPLSKFKSIGVPVFNTPGANANAVKELVLAGMLIASRHLFSAWSELLSLSGDDIAERAEQIKKNYCGHELAGKTLGLVGLGAIGVKVANMALALGMNVIAIDPKITIKNAWQLSANVKQADSLSELIKACDFLSLHVPYNEHTHHLLDKDKCKLLKSNAVLLNFSRAQVVDEKAILHLLNEERLFRYVCDFPSEPLLKNNKVLCLPHLGASTRESEAHCAVMAVNTLKRFLETGEIENSVNFPSVAMPYTYGTRLAICNQNVPNMLSQVSNQLATHGLNIIDMINRSKDDVAYTLIDVEGDVTETTLSQLTAIEGVLNCRKILTINGPVSS